MAGKWTSGELNGLALVAGAFILVGMTIGGYVLGFWIDRALHTAPVGAVTGLILGTLIGFWDLYRIAMRVMQRQPAPPPLPEDEDTAGMPQDDE